MGIIRAEIKAKAKNSIKTSRPSVPMVALVYLVVINVLSLLVFRATGMWEMLSIPIDPLNPEAYFADLTHAMNANITLPVFLICLVIEIMAVVLAAGFTIFAMNAARLRPATFGNLLDGFGIFFKVVWINILMGVFIFLWSLLLFIPGIIAVYRYSQALYIMLDNPDMTALECIRASKELMRGRKWELFVLHLSFIGWAILAALPNVLVPIPYVAAAIVIALQIWIMPYMQITFVNYHDALTGLRDPERLNQAPPPGSEGDGKPPWEF